jgi:hypothetical protein
MILSASAGSCPASLPNAVAADVIRMRVRVDDVADAAGGKLLDGARTCDADRSILLSTIRTPSDPTCTVMLPLPADARR